MMFTPLLKRVRGALLGLAALTATACAWSQAAGLYTGLTSQGQPVTLQIGPGASGTPALLFVSVVYNLHCTTTGRVLADGYAVGSDVRLNAQGGFNKQLYFIRAHGAMNAQFDGSSTFTGSTSLTTAKLLPALPVTAEGCDAADVAFSATLQSALE